MSRLLDEVDVDPTINTYCIFHKRDKSNRLIVLLRGVWNKLCDLYQLIFIYLNLSRKKFRTDDWQESCMYVCVKYGS